MNKRLIIITVFVLAVFAIATYIRLYPRPLTDGKITRISPAPTSSISSTSAVTARPQVEFLTSKGSFTVELRPDVAPQTVANFLAKWNSGYCNNLTFHRVEDWVVQGCDPKGNGTGGQTTLPTETSTHTFVAGSIGVARKPYPTDLSNDSQFFIVKKDSPFLDREYTYFGTVVSGMSVVDSLAIGDKIISTTFLGK